MSSTDFTSSSTTAANSTPPKNKEQQVKDLLMERATKGAPLQKPDAASGADSHAAPESRPAPTDGNIIPDVERPALELDDDEDVEKVKKPPDKTLRDFAAEHGISVKQLMGLIATDPGESDEPLSLGALRDHWRETKRFQQERDSFDDWRDNAQNEIGVAQRQVQDIFERIAGLVPPQTLARVFSDAEYEHAERIKQAKAQTLEYFPEWRDPEKMAVDRDRLVNMVASYSGSKEKARHYVANLKDPIVVKFMMDALRLKDRYDRLKTGYERDRPKAATQAPSRKGHRPSTDERVKAMAERGDKDGAIALLVEGALRNGNGKS